MEALVVGGSCLGMGFFPSRPVGQTRQTATRQFCKSTNTYEIWSQDRGSENWTSIARHNNVHVRRLGPHAWRWHALCLHGRRVWVPTKLNVNGTACHILRYRRENFHQIRTMILRRNALLKRVRARNGHCVCVMIFRSRSWQRTKSRVATDLKMSHASPLPGCPSTSFAVLCHDFRFMSFLCSVSTPSSPIAL